MAWILELLFLSRIPAKSFDENGNLKTNQEVWLDRPSLLQSETGPVRENAWFEMSVGTTESVKERADTVLFSLREKYGDIPEEVTGWRNSGPGTLI